MLRNRLFVSGLFLLALCGCIGSMIIPPIKYAGSEYQITKKDDMDRLHRDMDTRILNSVSPIDKPFDARVLFVILSRALLEDAVTKSYMKAMAKSGISSPLIDADIKPQILSSNADEHERMLRRYLEALRRRNLFKEVDTTTSDNPESVHTPGYGVYICWSSETGGYSPSLIRFGDGQPESLLGESVTENEATQDMPGIRKRRVFPYKAFMTSQDSPYDELEAFYKDVLHDWLNQVERAAARHFKR